MDSIGLIKIIASIVVIVGGIARFIFWVRSRARISKNPLQVFLRDNNIYGNYKDGTERQLTYQSADYNPILIKKRSKIIFLRSEKVPSEREYVRYKLMSLDTLTLEERTLADQKPFQDGLDGSFEILQPSNMVISPNNSKILFIIEKYATGSELVQVDIDTGKFKELFSAENFDIIKSGKLKGKFLVGVSEIRERGRDIYYKVCDSKGNVIRNFENHKEYMQFRSQALVGK